MSFGGLLLLLGGVGLVTADRAQGQHPQPPGRALQFESWQPASAAWTTRGPVVARVEPDSRNRTRQALLGGVIGAAAGVLTCTAFSTLINDSAERGVSFCPLDTNLLFGGAGFVLGAVIGWTI